MKVSTYLAKLLAKEKIMKWIGMMTAILWSGFQAFGDTPYLLNYQGRLINGTNLVNQNVGLSLRLFTASSGGTPVYEDSNNVAVVDGLYATYLGAHPVRGFLVDALTNTEVWVETAVNGVTLSPRELMTSVGYSMSTRGLLVLTNGTVVVNPDNNTVGRIPTSNGSLISGGSSNNISSNTSYAVIGGGKANFIGYASYGAVIVGGISNRIAQASTHSAISGGEGNSIGTGSSHAFIGGGLGNTLGNNSAKSIIIGGEYNRIGDSSVYCSIFGGQNNTLIYNTWYGTIVGGHDNQIAEIADSSFIAGGYRNGVSNNASYAFVAGRGAKALHIGAFVWGDSSTTEVYSTANDQVTFRCQGGVRFMNTNGTLYAAWAPGASAWTIVSDRAMKENIESVDTKAVLQKVVELPISEWNYTGYPQRHIGPMAQDFHAAFPLNENDKAIDSGDLPGIALAAIQELARQNAALRAELETLKAQVKDLSK